MNYNDVNPHYVTRDLSKMEGLCPDHHPSTLTCTGIQTKNITRGYSNEISTEMTKK